MATKQISDGNVITLPASGAKSAGDIEEFGADATGFAGMWLKDTADTEDGPVAITGVWEVVKVTGETWTPGELLYWNGTGATTTAGADHLMGVAWNTVASGTLLGYCKFGG